MSKRASKLTLVCDLGTSLSKVLYQVGRNGSVKHLTIDAQHLILDADLIGNFNKTSEFGKPEDNVWLQTDDLDCHLVGRLAQEYRASTSIKSLKYESIGPKILAIVGAIAVKEKLSDSIKLDLAVLLPYGELSNSLELERELQQSISEFRFQGDTYQVELKKYHFCPEGSGILSHLLEKQSIELVQSETVAVLMFGYRNTSLLLFQNGTLSVDRSETTNLGFYNFSDRIIKQTSGLTRDDIQAAIYTCQENFINYQTAMGSEKSVTKLAVEDLIKSRDSQRASAEKSRLSTAISNSQKEYWQLIVAWLNEVLPPQRHLERLIYTGGTAGFFEQELNNYLLEKYSNIQITSTDEIEQELLSELNLSEVGLQKFKQQQLPLRFADIWGVFTRFSRYNLVSLDLAA